MLGERLLCAGRCSKQGRCSPEPPEPTLAPVGCIFCRGAVEPWRVGSRQGTGALQTLTGTYCGRGASEQSPDWGEGQTSEERSWQRKQKSHQGGRPRGGNEFGAFVGKQEAGVDGREEGERGVGV